MQTMKQAILRRLMLCWRLSLFQNLQVGSQPLSYLLIDPRIKILLDDRQRKPHNVQKSLRTCVVEKRVVKLIGQLSEATGDNEAYLAAEEGCVYRIFSSNCNRRTYVPLSISIRRICSPDEQ
jgi:hypothetical protein